MRLGALLVLAAAGGISLGNGPVYHTTFPTTGEQPISESGRWDEHGYATGIDWHDCWTDNGFGGGPTIAHGTQGVQSTDSFKDSTCLLGGTWNPDQSVEGVVWTVPDDFNNCAWEVEFRLRSKITANSNRGYEIGFNLSDRATNYILIVRWNGPIGSFTKFVDTRDDSWEVESGDTVSADITGNIITAYINGVPKVSADITSLGGTVWTDGNPGMGFNLEASRPGCDGTYTKYGFDSITAHGLQSGPAAPAPPVLLP